jgi:hypothetical protein
MPPRSRAHKADSVTERLHMEGNDADADADADADVGDYDYYDGDEEGARFLQVLHLQQQAVVQDNEIRSLRAQLAMQRAMMATLQDAMLREDGGGGGGAFRSTAADPPLIEACRAGDVDMVDILVDAGSDRDLVATALQVACQLGHADVAALLIARGADVRADHDSALLWACRSGDEAMARMLLEAGADAGALSGCPMRLAVRGGYHGVARLLARLLAVATRD